MEHSWLLPAGMEKFSWPILLTGELKSDNPVSTVEWVQYLKDLDRMMGRSIGNLSIGFRL